ncbi:Cutinase [Macrophomina phaseolina MS6]|uniref:cutinase n=1 Tax=Macrophomina phaseolina (strain MS6) TaxID=1126212 RepID=K2SX29_MACPH|nr:Cutinase [Macrophomina phaseolina MS6]
MKTTTIVSLFFVGLSLGSPINFEAREPEAVAELEARQFTGTGVTANELKNGPCKPVTYIFARGSTELGNLGQTVGPALANQLKSQFDVAVQGVDYPASLTTNFFGGSLVGISEMRDMFNLAASKCPDTIIVGGGYRYVGCNRELRPGTDSQEVRVPPSRTALSRTCPPASAIASPASSLSVIPTTCSPADAFQVFHRRSSGSSATPEISSVRAPLSLLCLTWIMSAAFPRLCRSWPVASGLLDRQIGSLCGLPFPGICGL